MNLMSQFIKYRWKIIAGFSTAMAIYIFLDAGSLSHSNALHQIAQENEAGMIWRNKGWTYINGLPQGDNGYIVSASSFREDLSCPEQKKYMEDHKDGYADELLYLEPVFRDHDCDYSHYVYHVDQSVAASRSQLFELRRPNSPYLREYECFFRKSEQGWILQTCRTNRAS
jgi:hypothetical protein